MDVLPSLHFIEFDDHFFFFSLVMYQPQFWKMDFLFIAF